MTAGAFFQFITVGECIIIAMLIWILARQSRTLRILNRMRPPKDQPND